MELHELNKLHARIDSRIDRIKKSLSLYSRTTPAYQTLDHSLTIALAEKSRYIRLIRQACTF